MLIFFSGSGEKYVRENVDGHMNIMLTYAEIHMRKFSAEGHNITTYPVPGTTAPKSGTMSRFLQYKKKRRRKNANRSRKSGK